MSCSVWSSQIVRCRCAQLALATVLTSPGHAATLSRVRLSKVVAPCDVKLMLTTHAVPLGSMVVLFMIIYYRIPGLLASLALIFYAGAVLALFKLIPVTLTLAGITGFILSVGMA